MCQDCGCDQTSKSVLFFQKKIHLEKNVLEKNDLIASLNRSWFAREGVFVVNMMSSPGSGKTTLLEETVKKWQERDGAKVTSVIEGQNQLAILTGDQQHDFDALRLQNLGAQAKQIQTHSSCHLDAGMIQSEIGSFVRPGVQTLIIENVGNLVCPSAFDLGENCRVALLSTTEGEDKPSKYPLLFHGADLTVITKMDLVPYLDWDLQKCVDHIRGVNEKCPIILLSAKTGLGMQEWLDWLLKRSTSKDLEQKNKIGTYSLDIRQV